MKGQVLVAWNLRRVRVARGLSQERLAADAGVDRAYLGGLERQAENPTVDLLDRVADTLGVPSDELFVAPAEGETAPRPLSGRRKRYRGFGWRDKLIAPQRQRPASNRRNRLGFAAEQRLWNADRCLGLCR